MVSTIISENSNSTDFAKAQNDIVLHRMEDGKFRAVINIKEEQKKEIYRDLNKKMSK